MNEDEFFFLDEDSGRRSSGKASEYHFVGHAGQLVEGVNLSEEERKKRASWFYKIAGLDAFPKLDAKHLRQSTPGGVATVILVTMMLLLSLLELFQFIVVPFTTSTILIDPKVSHRLSMQLDISIASPCDSILVELMDTHGRKVTVNPLLDATRIRFISLNSTLTHSPGNVHKEQELLGRKVKSSKHRNAMFDILKAFSTRNGEDPETPSQEDSDDDALDFGREREGCRISGTLPIDDVSGTLSITPMLHIQLGLSGISVHLEELNLSHIIHKMSFGADFPGIQNPLDKFVEAALHPFYMYQYFISVIPTTFDNWVSQVASNQYSVNQYVRELGKNKPGAVGITFTYEMEPLAIKITREREGSFLDFLIRICGIGSGLFTFSGLLHSSIYWAWSFWSPDTIHNYQVAVLSEINQ